MLILILFSTLILLSSIKYLHVLRDCIRRSVGIRNCRKPRGRVVRVRKSRGWSLASVAACSGTGRYSVITNSRVPANPPFIPY